MLIGKLTQDVKLLAQAFVRAAGETVSQREVPPAVWEAWLAEGIITLPTVTAVTPQERAALRRKSDRLRG